jgi:CRP/FNR family cyclic AMP-dependent transcriptional regulator
MAVDRLAALRASPMLRDFSDVGLRILAEAVQERQVGRGVYSFRAGEASTGLDFIARGTLQLLAREGGAALGELTAGDTLGGLSLLTPGEHFVSALAINEVTLLSLSKAVFNKMQEAHPRTALKLTLALARDLAERMQDAKSPLREFLVWQVSKRH